jgi:signal transduction histidine kinase
VTRPPGSGILEAVPKGKLTRQELGWLLMQEARGAAERLRKGVSALTQAPPPPGADATGVDATLSALDDAMRLLSNLHSRPLGARGRRGRIDVAALLWEVAPEARVSIAPGSGTEVFGDEAELRRMLHVMVGFGSGSGSVVTIRREADEVVTGVVLGPEGSTISDTERAWLARMALRYGGRFELEGSTEVLSLPAEGVEARDDVERLRKELDEAKKQGALYARELASVIASGDESALLSTAPPSATPAVDRHGVVVRLAGGVAAALRTMLSPVGRELAELRAVASPRQGSPDVQVTAPLRAVLEERMEAIRGKLLVVQDFLGELTALGDADPQEPRRTVDLVEIVRAEVRSLSPRMLRAGVTVDVQTIPSDTGAPVMVTLAPRSAAAVVRALVAHAVSATPRGAQATVTVVASDTADGKGPRLWVDDAGTKLPEAARRALLDLDVEPGTFGRPTSVGLFAAAQVVVAQGGLLELGDAPVRVGPGADSGGGVRVMIGFPP